MHCVFARDAHGRGLFRLPVSDPRARAKLRGRSVKGTKIEILRVEFAADPCVLVIKKLHRHADAVKPAFNREIGGDGRIHSAAHRDERLAARVIGVKAYILPLKKARKPRRKSRSLWGNYLSVLKKRSRQIAVACVGQEHDYRLALVLRALCKLYRGISGGA